jgi:hypothetical protein
MTVSEYIPGKVHSAKHLSASSSQYTPIVPDCTRVHGTTQSPVNDEKRGSGLECQNCGGSGGQFWEMPRSSAVRTYIVQKTAGREAPI